ncbi:HNH endonuclease [Nodosilinea sp. FACHB-131]|uniref:HNH endonuclease n=1 Tax=Cyanophyceae TaxID=3028117 RepID=UPI0016832A61|nr:HNH endonuclease [Nodosilinea sp. FACHB-131]MBD1876945.1 HNH endonuclease [Nodosilinea sp. FACHB-131]
MPMIKARYPANWDAIARSVKEQANWCCQECGRQCQCPDESLEQLRSRIGKAKPRQYLLTVAHLDQTPANCTQDNLKALCTVCHLRYDRQFRARQRASLREWFGQLSLLEVTL